MLKIAFAGFRHGHIMGLYNTCRNHPGVKLVAACEEDAPTRESLNAAGKVEIGHSDYQHMLETVDCDAIAVGDYFAKRGALIIAALKAGKHVISDKPVCTRISELEEIAGLVKTMDRRLGCLLDLRDSGVFITARKLIRQGAIGEVLTANFTAQHPLLRATRPKWYFEQGKHGGTINDIAVHGIDLIPWVTGRQIAYVVSARTWNARVPEAPQFHDGGQFMLKMDNGGGVLGDVSYFTPDALAYSAPQYWRLTVHGTEGLVEASFSQRTVMLAKAADKAPQSVPLEKDHPTGCLDAFIGDVEGRSDAAHLTSAEALRASRVTLLIQQAADRNECNVPLS
ncbi:MAG TPA: Gfo/Idh/MocA family oxidoreductase [Tepidisphaeraceae bacterium]|jgi:predicted dehydrogenase